MANKSNRDLMLAAIDVLEESELLGSAKILVSVFNTLHTNDNLIT